MFVCGIALLRKRTVIKVCTPALCYIPWSLYRIRTHPPCGFPAPLCPGRAISDTISLNERDTAGGLILLAPPTPEPPTKQPGVATICG